MPDIESVEIHFTLSIDYLIGDVNNDGDINILDIVIIVRLF